MRGVKIRGLLLLLLFLASIVSIRAQEDEPIKMTPDFALNFPVTMANQHDVTVKYPILINPLTVLAPGTVLRVIYVPPVQSDSTDLVLAHKGNMEESYSRPAGGSDDQGSRMPPEMAHEIETQRRRVWEVPNNFVLAIAQYPTDLMHLIYSTGRVSSGLLGKKEDLHDTSFSFFDGLFIGAPNGKVSVLGVENGSKADVAGIKAGDDIVAVGGVPMQGDLHQFATAFSTAKETARENEAASYPVTIRSANGAERTVGIGTPLSIKSSLMDGFK
jgi:hypothetical protein